MDIRGWDQRYRSKQRRSEDFDAPPTPLLIETARHLRPGKALDLAMPSLDYTRVVREEGTGSVRGGCAERAQGRDAYSSYSYLPQSFLKPFIVNVITMLGSPADGRKHTCGLSLSS